MDAEGPSGGWGYAYDFEWDVGAVGVVGKAEGVMSTFKQNPAEIFPFTVSRCTALYHGVTCRLSETVPDPWGKAGDVRVTTTPTAVRFTVTSGSYFDAPGSTITFRTVERAGRVYLKQSARVASSKDGSGFSSVPTLGAYFTWWQQWQNLKRKVSSKKGLL